MDADRIKESSTSQAIKNADWFSYNGCRVTARRSGVLAVTLSKSGSKIAVRFDYHSGGNINGDNYPLFLSLLVHKKQSEQCENNSRTHSQIVGNHSPSS